MPHVFVAVGLIHVAVAVKVDVAVAVKVDVAVAVLVYVELGFGVEITGGLIGVVVTDVSVGVGVIGV
jgi:hypothetical protein